MIERVMIIAGEASGDLHGSGIVRDFKKRFPSVDVFGVGGDRMKSEGMDLVIHNSRLSMMGFWEVFKNLHVIRSVERELEEILESRKPDVLLLIDYPGFNLRFAKKAKRHGIKVLYYISPQVWAWHRGRVKKMKTLVDRMKVVFPFEVEIYKSEGIDVEFVGHPLAERIGKTKDRSSFLHEFGFEDSLKLLGLFPGSRKQEIEKIFPTMLATAAELHSWFGVQIAVGVAPNLGSEYLRQFIPKELPVSLVENGTHNLMAHSDAAIVTSGTATLEAGWFGTPMCIVYKTSTLTYWIGRMLVNVPFIGLANIVAGRRVVPEFVQSDMTVGKLSEELGRLLTDQAYAKIMRSALSIIKEKLGEPGASSKVVDGIVALGETV